MKDAMVEKHGEMTFWPVSLRPPDQLELEIGEGKPYPTLQETLRKKYAGETMTFEQLLTRDYPSGDAWLTKHYRSAVKAMAEGDHPEAVIERKNPLTPTGKPAKGLDLPDTVTFKKTSD
jgi:hypothetical protein